MDPVLLRAYATSLLVRGLVSLPVPVLRRLGGRPPAVARELEPEAWFLARLATLAERLAGGHSIPPLDEQRVIADAETRFLAVGPRRPVHTEDRTADGIPVRLYVPEGANDEGPLLVFFHGGGWVQRSIASHDASVRLLAHLSGIRIVSVEYRRAPEHPFPTPVDDALAAYTHIATHAGAYGADPTRIGVGGDSAGGNLAAGVALTADPRPAFQWLLYPAVDAVNRHPSAKAFATGFYLTEAAMDKYIDLYLPDRDRRADPRASPLLAADLSAMPPAYVAIAAADPLRDEGEAYAQRLRDAGVPAVTQRFGQLHGFFNVTVMRSAREAVAVTAGALRHGLR